MSMLSDQIGICDFAPFKDMFILAAARSRVAISPLPSVQSLFFHTHRNWKEAGPKNGKPVLGLQLSSLVKQLQESYQCVTKGKFDVAIEKFKRTGTMGLNKT